MWILTLLHCALLTRAVSNYTIDDASPIITYDPSVLERNISGFDSRLLWDGTITYIAPALNSSPTITIPFNGTAIYIFVAYPGIVQPAPSGFNAFIDGAPAGNWAAAESALLYHHLVYHTANLTATPHTLVMQIQPGWELYFDYAIYTSDVDPPPASVSTSSMSAPQQSPSGMISTPPTPPTPPTPGASEEMTTVLTVSGGVSAVYIMSTVTQPPEISTLIATSISQTLSGTASTTSASLTHIGTSPILSGTSQAAGTVAATSSNITTIIRTAATPPVVPMISAFLGGALFATFVMVVCLICVRRQRSRNRKRAPWSFNAAGFRWHGTDGTGEPGDAREKCKSATDFDADSHFEGITDEAE